MWAWHRAIWKAFGELARGLADLALPGVCAACGAAEIAAEGLCTDCNVKLLALVSLPYCPRCGTTVGPNIPISEEGCAACPDPLPRFAQVVRLGPYTDPLRGVIRELKYRRRDWLHHRLGRMLGRAAGRLNETKADLVVPVPMHWRRRLARSCDHARVLASAVAEELGLPLGDELIRIRHTAPQVHLSRTRRIENVHRAFALRRSARLEGANILLVDDVTTTGATADEAARALLRAGASKVLLAVVAKAEPPTAYAAHWS
jgi:ComF family protein